MFRMNILSKNFSGYGLSIRKDQFRLHKKINLFKKLFASAWLNHETKFRFILVGIWNTIFSYIVFVVLDYLFNLYLSPRYVAYMLAAVFTNIIAVTLAYFLHKNITFKSKTKGKTALIEYLRFYMTYIFTSVLSLLLLPVFVEYLKLDPKIAAAFIMILLTVVSYISHSLFSFRQERITPGQ